MPSALTLTLIYWLHLLATILWLGGLTAQGLLVLPAARSALDDVAYAALLGKLRPRMQSLGWFCLALLGVTGLFQMSASPHYEGFLAITNAWSVAIFAKHIAVGGMLLLAGFETWGLMPALQRQALRIAAGQTLAPEQLLPLRRQERTLLTLNLVLAAIVLLLTAYARASAS